jgi:hypothetical protein
MRCPAVIDAARDVRLPAHLTDLQLADDVAEFAAHRRLNPEALTYGWEWAEYARARGWHPTWAAHVARAYHRALADCAGLDRESARESSLAQHIEHLAWLRAQDPEKVGGLPSAILACLKEIGVLTGVEAKPAVSVHLHQHMTADDLADLSDEDLKAQEARLIEAEARTEDAAGRGGDLGGGPAEGNPAAGVPVGSPVYHNHPSPAQKALPPPALSKTGPLSADGTATNLGVCPGCGVVLRAIKPHVRASDGLNWHPGCLRRYGDSKHAQ